MDMLPPDGGCSPGCKPGEVCNNGTCVPICSDPGLLMYLPFNSSLMDTAGGGSEAPLSGSPAYDTLEGKPAPSLVRGVGTSGISYAGSNFNLWAGTVVLWLQLSSWSAALKAALYTATDASGSVVFGIEVPKSGGQIKVYSEVKGTMPYTSGCNVSYISTKTGSTSKWNMVAFIWDTTGVGSMAAYWDLNGYLDTGTNCKVAGPLPKISKVLVGGGVAPTGQSTTIWIDEVRVFNRALTLPELQKIAATGCPKQ